RPRNRPRRARKSPGRASRRSRLRRSQAESGRPAAVPEGFAPRFAVEAAFLILLAVGLGLADLRPAVIIGVMAAAWVLVSLIEWLAWRAAQTASPVWPEALPPPEVEPERAPGWDMQEILVPAEEQ